MWPVAFLLYFGLGKIAYSAVTRHTRKDIWFLLAESSTTAVLFVGGGYLVSTLRFGWAARLHVPAEIAKSLSLAALFCAPSLALRLSMLRREVFHPQRILVPAGLTKAGLTKKVESRFASLGIIDPTWLLLLSSGLAVIWVLATRPPLSEPLPSPGYRIDYYKQYYELSSLLFSQSVTGLLAIGSILAVCMTILLTGGKWHSSEAELARRDYEQDLRSALKMVCGGLLFLFGFLIWVLGPLDQRMCGVLDRLK